MADFFAKNRDFLAIFQAINLRFFEKNLQKKIAIFGATKSPAPKNRDFMEYRRLIGDTHIYDLKYFLLFEVKYTRMLTVSCIGINTLLTVISSISLICYEMMFTMFYLGNHLDCKSNLIVFL